ncbi:MAG: hypothetical protein R3B06_05555 [Kofleriaceae bacterium]
MDDVPDLRDLRGRTKRLALAAVVATGVAVLVYHLTYAAAADDIEHGSQFCGAHSQDSALRFVFSMVTASFAFTTVVVERLLAWRARVDERLPRAAVRRPRPPGG